MISRILIVGYGSIGKRHLRIARETFPSADIYVLRHQSHIGAIEHANGCFNHLTEACAFSPQVAIVANPASFHIEIALALASVECHLLIEKPLSNTAENVDAFLKLAKEKNIIIQVGYNMRHLSSLKQFRDDINAGMIGRVLSIRCEVGQYLPSWRLDNDYRQTVSAQHALGGGVLLELSHELDYLRWIFGEIEWVNAWLGKLSDLEVNVEDTAHIILGFMRTSVHDTLVAAVTLDFIRRDPTRVCTVIGERSSLRWNGITNTVERYSVDDAMWQLDFKGSLERDESYYAQWKNFLACIDNVETPLVSGKDGFEVLKIIEAVRQSSGLQSKRISIRHLV